MPPQRPADLPFHAVESLDLRLSYADCDPAQIIYFAAWFPWMERVQSAWMFRHGLRQDQLASRFGFEVVTRSAQCEYLHPCRLFDALTIEVGVGRLGNTSLTWAYRMLRDDAVVVAVASSTMVTLDLDGAPVPLPAELLRAIDEDLAIAGVARRH